VGRCGLSRAAHGIPVAFARDAVPLLTDQAKTRVEKPDLVAFGAPDEGDRDRPPAGPLGARRGYASSNPCSTFTALRPMASTA